MSADERVREGLDHASRDDADAGWYGFVTRDDVAALVAEHETLRERCESMDYSHAVRVVALTEENETLRAAHQRCCDETDYCYVCDNHPSHGHAKTCALAAVSARGGDAA
jgi:hypothetical protein